MANISSPRLAESLAPGEVNLLPIQEPMTLEGTLTPRNIHLTIRIGTTETSSATIYRTLIEIILNPNEDISFEAVFGQFLKNNVQNSLFRKITLSVHRSMYDGRVVSLFDNFTTYLKNFHVKCDEFAFFLRKEQQLENFIEIFEPAILSPKDDMDIDLVLGLIVTQCPLPNHIRLNNYYGGDQMMKLFEIVEIELSEALMSKSIAKIKKRWDRLSASEKSQKVEVKSGYHWLQYSISVRNFTSKSQLTVSYSQGKEHDLLSIHLFKFAGSSNFPFQAGILCFVNGYLHAMLLKTRSQEKLEEQLNGVYLGGNRLLGEACKEFIAKMKSPNSAETPQQ